MQFARFSTRQTQMLGVIHHLLLLDNLWDSKTLTLNTKTLPEKGTFFEVNPPLAGTSFTQTANAPDQVARL